MSGGGEEPTLSTSMDSTPPSRKSNLDYNLGSHIIPPVESAIFGFETRIGRQDPCVERNKLWYLALTLRWGDERNSNGRRMLDRPGSRALNRGFRVT